TRLSGYHSSLLFYTAPSTSETYTLSLHDALPILVLSPPPLTMSEFFARTIQSKKMMEEAEQVLPNGVTANIKFFDPYPIVMKFGNGPYLTDVDGNLYIDYSLSYGALMCGHGHPR